MADVHGCLARRHGAAPVRHVTAVVEWAGPGLRGLRLSGRLRYAERAGAVPREVLFRTWLGIGGDRAERCRRCGPAPRGAGRGAVAGSRAMLGVSGSHLAGRRAHESSGSRARFGCWAATAGTVASHSVPRRGMPDLPGRTRAQGWAGDDWARNGRAGVSRSKAQAREEGWPCRGAAGREPALPRHEVSAGHGVGWTQRCRGGANNGAVPTTGVGGRGRGGRGREGEGGPPGSGREGSGMWRAHPEHPTRTPLRRPSDQAGPTSPPPRPT